MRKNKRNYIVFDESKLYSIPMIPKTIDSIYSTNDNGVRTTAKLRNSGDGYINLSSEGYYDLNIADKQFEFFLYTGYAKVVE